MTIGEKITFLRKQKNMSLEDLAKTVGVKKQTIFKYENGTVTNIPSDKIERIAKALDTTPQSLMGWTLIIDENDGFGSIINDFGSVCFTKEEVNEISDFIRYVLSKRNK